ncbi:MAG: hypothetical protein FJ245_10385 [Nitrospira sp.]|nr:hypothetical protein [Nitrospira sp.]
MDPWILIIAFLVVLILLYAAFFYLASLVREGSPFRIWLSYLGPRIRSRLSLYVPTRATESNQRSLYPKNLESPEPEPAKAAPPPSAIKPAKQPVRPTRTKSTSPPSPSAMASPSAKPFSRQTAKKAAAEQRRVWIKYLDGGRTPVEDKLEIYQTTIDGNLLAWFCSKRKYETFLRRRIVAWQLLNETFDRSNQIEQWARREAMLGLPKRLYRMLKTDD